MKKMNLFLCMLLAAMMLPTVVTAQTMTTISTFNKLDDYWDNENWHYVIGKLMTKEGNDWGFTSSSWIVYPKQTTYDGVFAITLEEPTTFYSGFAMREYVLSITVRAGGNLSQIGAYISGVSLAKCDLGTIDVTTSEVKDYVFTVDPSAGETALAADGRPVYIVLTPGSGSDATAIESIRLETSLYPPGEIDENSGVLEGGLTWRVERDCYLTISGSGPMPDFANVKDTPWYDYWLTGVEVKDGVTNIGDNSFDGKAVYGVILPKNSLRRIGKDAFFGNNFSSIDLPEGLEEIGNQAFAYTGLESITIPSTVSSIGSFVFNGCSAMETMTVAAGNPTYSSPGNCNAIIKPAEKELAYGCKNTIIPDDVLTIGNYAFFGCAMEGLDIPANITKIGSFAFYDCKSLKDIVLLDNVESIDQDAFNGCSAMETITIGSGLTFIGRDAFASLNSLTDITCTADPENLTWKGNDAVNCCKSDGTTKFHVTDPAAWKAKFPDAHVQFVTIGGAETPEGDVSGDGKTDAEDIVALMNYIAGKTAGISATAADVNKDGKVDVADVVALINLIIRE